MFMSACLKTDSQGSGCAPAHTWYLLDLWCPCRQHALTGVLVYLCCIQLITSKFFSNQGLHSLTYCHFLLKVVLFVFLGVLCILVPLSPQLWGMRHLWCFNYIFGWLLCLKCMLLCWCHRFCWDKLLIFFFLQVRAAFKHKTQVWSLTSSSIRNINVKPFNSDIVSVDDKILVSKDFF